MSIVPFDIFALNIESQITFVYLNSLLRKLLIEK